MDKKLQKLQKLCLMLKDITEIERYIDDLMLEVSDESQKEEARRLDALFERLENAIEQGDQTGEKAIREEIERFVAGTSASADSTHTKSTDSSRDAD